VAFADGSEAENPSRREMKIRAYGDAVAGAMKDVLKAAKLVPAALGESEEE